MPHLTLTTSPGAGPILDVLIGVSEPLRKIMKTQGAAVPKPVSIRVLLDTGASGTCVDLATLSALGLVPTGTALIHTVSTTGTPVPAALYDVSLALVHPGQQFVRWFDAVPVMGASLAAQGIQGLVGRDILAQCLLVYDGQAGTFTLAF